MMQRDPCGTQAPHGARALLWAVLACVMLHAGVASAGPKDAQVLKLDDDAINNDFLATKFADAERKLKQAIALCGKAGCSTNVLAQLHRDLGIILVVSSKPDEAKARFVEALQIDPSTAIPKELKTADVEQVFASAKGGPAPAAPPKPAPPAAGPSGGEEIVHTPPSESAIMTPVPLYAELPEGMAPTKVQVRYKPFGAPNWKSVDMKKLKQGYGIELPCLEIGSTPGDLKYYIQALGPGGEVMATNGTKNAPLKVTTKTSIAGEAPRLPGKPPPKQCVGGSGTDCPPEFPGCNESKKGGGFSCDTDGECQSGQCKNGSCFSDEALETKCESDAGCEAGQWCSDGICRSPKKNWIGAAVQQDALFAPAATDVCLNQTDYSCFYSDDGSYYGGQHAVAGSSDAVAGGFTQSTTRLLLSYDRVVADNVTIGVRIGYAFGGAPAKPDGKSFFPAHGEARGAYWFGADPFIRSGIRPYVTAAFGAGQYDGKVAVKVFDGVTNPQVIDVSAWKKADSMFGAVGFGMMFPLDHNSGIVGELKGVATFPTFGLAVSLQVGFVMGI